MRGGGTPCYDNEWNGDDLLPGLPNHLAQLCLAKVPAPVLFSVCKSWRRLLYNSPSFPAFLCLYFLLGDELCSEDFVENGHFHGGNRSLSQKVAENECFYGRADEETHHQAEEAVADITVYDSSEDAENHLFESGEAKRTSQIVERNHQSEFRGTQHLDYEEIADESYRTEFDYHHHYHELGKRKRHHPRGEFRKRNHIDEEELNERTHHHLYHQRNHIDEEEINERTHHHHQRERQQQHTQHSSTNLTWTAFDPLSGHWEALPPPPPHRPFLLRSPTFLSRTLPIQTLTAYGHLLTIAATTSPLLPALPRPLAFNPQSRCWRFGPALPAPRRWCATGALGPTVVVASGTGCQFNQTVARSTLAWSMDQLPWCWREVACMKNTRFAREAIEATAYKGRLCMVNVRAGLVREGVVYDGGRDEWEAMPEGMLTGWPAGPVVGMEGSDEMYGVDEREGVLKRYEEERGEWKEVVKVEEMRGAEGAAAGGGRVCVIGEGGRVCVVVEVAREVRRVWMVRPPARRRMVAVHVLPRMGPVAVPWSMHPFEECRRLAGYSGLWTDSFC
ncbi:F-box/kelch-repeat protein SKIP25 isoform X2 [Amborella trichopoda]|uniref:F-box/kelch-repeat protein SKIP25 isoform X2 n=1 Tax=Amborella trichopoda TaxID=13333 RepID=UPI0009BD7A17|nr:F-box/kelch-repeat protein SKIP25 isoform X2 [Amborella trichopoda]|eukprot:XP_020529087.1 F-box/kelch-repeat protein SKIP25 isoform X2 [Amborella trichopoda]